MAFLNVLMLEGFALPVLFSAPEFLDFLLRFVFNFIVAYTVIRWIYYPVHKNKDYLFTYFLFNIIIFVLCYMMKNSQLQIGVAFGLFAVFSVLRYRTMNVSIMDMAYLFLVNRLRLWVEELEVLRQFYFFDVLLLVFSCPKFLPQSLPKFLTPMAIM